MNNLHNQLTSFCIFVLWCLYNIMLGIADWSTSDNGRYYAYMDLQMDLDSVYFRFSKLIHLVKCMYWIAFIVQICCNHEFNFLCSALNGNRSIHDHPFLTTIFFLWYIVLIYLVIWFLAGKVWRSRAMNFIKSCSWIFNLLRFFYVRMIIFASKSRVIFV